MSIASDFYSSDAGVSEPASPEMPASAPGGMPTDGAETALSQQAVDAEPASGAFDEAVVTDELLDFLKRERGWVPQEDLNKFRSTYDQQISNWRSQAGAARQQVDFLNAQQEATTQTIQEFADEHGLDDSQLKQLAYKVRDKLDAYQGQQQENQQIIQQELGKAAKGMASHIQSIGRDQSGQMLVDIQHPEIQSAMKNLLGFHHQAMLDGNSRSEELLDAARNKFFQTVQKHRDAGLLNGRTAQAGTAQPAATAGQAAPQPRRGPQNTARGGGAAAGSFKEVLASVINNNPDRDYQENYVEARVLASQR